eukprot:TRINITY_DN5563_c0_g2_i2.p1 TRINITY_DN5563_c0_g2~~TRINITY_DN5563_c0_g2_i2.p1  ORF type:complete len:1428 (+),score=243.50 TRINITY_DN5563_c0_g2_i2:80-4363(+)
MFRQESSHCGQLLVWLHLLLAVYRQPSAQAFLSYSVLCCSPTTPLSCSYCISINMCSEAVLDLHQRLCSYDNQNTDADLAPIADDLMENKNCSLWVSSLLSAGVVAVLIGLLRSQHVLSRRVHLAVQTICCGDAGKQAVLDCGGMQCLLALLTSPNDGVVLDALTTLVQVLLQHSIAIRALMSSGGLRLLHNLMNAANVTVSAFSCHAMAVCLCVQDVCTFLRRSGLITTLVTLLDDHNPRVRCHAAFGLCQCMWIPDHVIEFRKSSGVTRVSSLLRVIATEHDLVSTQTAVSLCALIGRVSARDDVCSLLVKHDVDATLFQLCLQTQNAKLESIAAWALSQYLLFASSGAHLQFNVERSFNEQCGLREVSGGLPKWFTLLPACVAAMPQLVNALENPTSSIELRLVITCLLAHCAGQDELLRHPAMPQIIPLVQRQIHVAEPDLCLFSCVLLGRCYTLLSIHHDLGEALLTVFHDTSDVKLQNFAMFAIAGWAIQTQHQLDSSARDVLIRTALDHLAQPESLTSAGSVILYTLGLESHSHLVTNQVMHTLLGELTTNAALPTVCALSAILQSAVVCDMFLTARGPAALLKLCSAPRSLLLEMVLKCVQLCAQDPRGASDIVHLSGTSLIALLIRVEMLPAVIPELAASVLQSCACCDEYRQEMQKHGVVRYLGSVLAAENVRLKRLALVTLESLVSETTCKAELRKSGILAALCGLTSSEAAIATCAMDVLAVACTDSLQSALIVLRSGILPVCLALFDNSTTARAACQLVAVLSSYTELQQELLTGNLTARLFGCVSRTHGGCAASLNALNNLMSSPLARTVVIAQLRIESLIPTLLDLLPGEFAGLCATLFSKLSDSFTDVQAQQILFAVTSSIRTSNDLSCLLPCCQALSKLIPMCSTDVVSEHGVEECLAELRDRLPSVGGFGMFVQSLAVCCLADRRFEHTERGVVCALQCLRDNSDNVDVVTSVAAFVTEITAHTPEIVQCVRAYSLSLWEALATHSHDASSQIIVHALRNCSCGSAAEWICPHDDDDVVPQRPFISQDPAYGFSAAIADAQMQSNLIRTITGLLYDTNADVCRQAVVELAAACRHRAHAKLAVASGAVSGVCALFDFELDKVSAGEQYAIALLVVDLVSHVDACAATLVNGGVFSLLYSFLSGDLEEYMVDVVCSALHLLQTASQQLFDRFVGERRLGDQVMRQIAVSTSVSSVVNFIEVLAICNSDSSSGEVLALHNALRLLSSVATASERITAVFLALTDPVRRLCLAAKVEHVLLALTTCLNYPVEQVQTGICRVLVDCASHEVELSDSGVLAALLPRVSQLTHFNCIEILRLLARVVESHDSRSIRILCDFELLAFAVTSCTNSDAELALAAIDLIASLARESDHARSILRKAGGVRVMVQLLQIADEQLQSSAVRALSCLQQSE